MVYLVMALRNGLCVAVGTSHEPTICEDRG
jgi:hypothetical protein